MDRLILSGSAAVKVAVFLATVLLLTVLWASVHGPTSRHSVLIDDCALVLDRSGRQTCR